MCPKCDSRMIRMIDAKQSHIWFEHCGSCFGHFFDAGELKDLKKNTVVDFIKSWFTPERKLEYESVIMNSLHHFNVFRVVAFFK